jgi:hypothetical protein
MPSESLLTKDDARRLMLALYDVDFLSWSALEIHRQLQSAPDYDESGMNRNLQTEATFLMQRVPTLVMLRLGAVVEECVEKMCEGLLGPGQYERKRLLERVKGVNAVRPLDVTGLTALWQTRNAVAHNVEAAVSWENVRAFELIAEALVKPLAIEADPEGYTPRV